MYRILVINPGSTSTKIAVYDDEKEILNTSISHSTEELKKFNRVVDQYEFRKELILKTLEENNISIKSLSAIAARGGNMKPVPSGTFLVNERMVEDLKNPEYGEHPSDLGGIIALDLAKQLGINAYVVDPVIVDEMHDLARIAGHPLFKRKAKDHPLNQKAVARQCAKMLGITYEEGNFIVAHMGGGLSVGAHRRGKIIDVNNALDGDGAFSPERSGRLPSGDVARFCFSGKVTLEEFKKMLVGKGGIVAHLGTNDLREVMKMIEEGDEKAKLVLEAFCYNIAKDIGAAAAVLEGEVDAIILTGGVAHQERVVKEISQRVSFIAPIFVFAGSFEMQALRDGVLRVLRGEEEAKIYS